MIAKPVSAVGPIAVATVVVRAPAVGSAAASDPIRDAAAGEGGAGSNHAHATERRAVRASMPAYSTASAVTGETFVARLDGAREAITARTAAEISTTATRGMGTVGRK